MGAFAVARKDLRNAVQSPALWYVSALFVAAFAGFAYVYATVIVDQSSPRVDPGTVDAILVIAGVGSSGVGPVLSLVPVVGLLLGYRAIAGERDTGSVRLLLSLPHTRREVVLGKLLGRAAVAAAGVLAGFLAGAAVLVATLGSLAPLPFLAFLLTTTLLAVVHVAVGIAISAGVAREGLAATLVAAFLGVFQLAWGALFDLARVALLGRPRTAPDWFRFARRLSPGDAYARALVAVVDLPAHRQASIQARLGVGGAEPFYLETAFGFVVLLAWAVCPLVVGYVLFERADL